MAIPLLPGSFRCQADYDRKVEDQFKYLRLRTKLNAISERATNRISLGAQPVPMPRQSTEEELLNIQQARVVAVASVAALIGRAEAYDFVERNLTSLNALNEFNQNFPDFRSTIQDKRPMDSDHMRVLWDQYKRVKASEVIRGSSIYALQDVADDLGYEIMSGCTGSCRDMARLQEMVDDAVMRFDIAALKAIRKRIYGK